MAATKTAAEVIVLRNLMRGQGSHRPARHRIADTLLRAKFRFSAELNQFLLESTYRIDPGQWQNFPFSDGDWEDARKISASRRSVMLENVVDLVEQHIVVNKETVNRLIEFSDLLSCALLETPEADPTGLFEKLLPVDRQSLFFWRVVAAANSQNGKLLARRISDEMRSTWATRKFLYPFVFFSVNQPPEGHIQTSLKYVLNGGEKEWERRLIEYAVGHQSSLIGNEAGFLWLSLLAHPFDALNLLCDVLEEHTSCGNTAPDALVECAERISNQVNFRRLNSMIRRHRGELIKFVNEPDIEGIQLPISKEAKSFYQSLILPHPLTAPPKDSDFLNSLARLRKEKYPSQLTYDQVVFSSRRWRFTEAGRLLSGIAYLLFMFPRSEWPTEYKQFLRLVDFYGGASVLLLMAPGVATASNRNKIFSKRWADLASEMEVRVEAIGSVEDRTWINLLHREVSQDQNAGRVSDWISKIERNCPIKRNYLSGADWPWIEEVLRSRKVQPFRGDWRAAYVFLLKGVEQGDPDFSVIRSILRPIYASINISDLINLIISAYEGRAAAFSYFFLSPQNLLLMEMSFNEIDAMAGRISALEECIRRYGFCETVTEDVYLDEIRALESAILYNSITSSQFEVPWQSFSNEMMIRTKDIYEASIELTQRNEGGAFPAGASETENTVTFPNGVSNKVTLPNFKWASADVALEIIKSFMRDPGYGLEAILGTRIRHNVIEREFVGALQSLAQHSLPGVFRDVSIRITDAFVGEIKTDIQTWVDSYMHSLRPGKPHGMFRITPDHKELNAIVETIENSDSHREAVRSVVLWLQKRLGEDLEAARHLVQVDLKRKLEESVQHARENIEAQGVERVQDIDSVARAIQSEIDRKISQVGHWFEWPEENSSQTASLWEICRATFARFTTEIEVRNIRVRLSNDLEGVTYPRTSARLILDIASEVMMNHLKHAGGSSTSMRVTIRVVEGKRFIAFSSSCLGGGRNEVRTVLGERHNSQIEHLLASTGSGLKRIAGAYATALGKQLQIAAASRNGFFHVLLPIDE